MNGIPLFMRDGFTIEGTGYYARHLESHQFLYGKESRILPAVIVAACLMVIFGIAVNVPGIAAAGGLALILLAFVRRRKATTAPPPKKGSGPRPAGGSPRMPFCQSRLSSRPGNTSPSGAGQPPLSDDANP